MFGDKKAKQERLERMGALPQLVCDNSGPPLRWTPSSRHKSH
jgi:hypothetical protein